MKKKAANTKPLDDLVMAEVVDLYQPANHQLSELAEARGTDDEAKVEATHGGATRANRTSA